MSQENVEVIKRGVVALNEAYAKDDISPWRQYVKEATDPEIVLETGTDAFTEGEWRGLDGAIGFVANQMEVLKNMWMRLDEVIEVGEDRAVIAISFGGRARHTEIPVELHPFHVFRFRDGKVMRWQIFHSRDQALKAAALSE